MRESREAYLRNRLQVAVSAMEVAADRLETLADRVRTTPGAARELREIEAWLRRAVTAATRD
jgi:hypothetical protein